jgi:hypothetical protein
MSSAAERLAFQKRCEEWTRQRQAEQAALVRKVEDSG